MQKLQKIINATAIATETSHIFCCVLPTIFSLLSLLVGLGVIGAVPASVTYFHDLIHDWEIPIIVLSGVVITFGWWLHDYASKMDCASMGPAHEVCESRKNTSAKVLKIATVLFVINVSVYFLVHRPIDQYNHNHGSHDIVREDAHAAHDHHDH